MKKVNSTHIELREVNKNLYFLKELLETIR